MSNNHGKGRFILNFKSTSFYIKQNKTKQKGHSEGLWCLLRGTSLLEFDSKLPYKVTSEVKHQPLPLPYSIRILKQLAKSASHGYNKPSLGDLQYIYSLYAKEKEILKDYSEKRAK